ncbi:hypothetical protein ANN_19205 [Periplaneta americana]|uniref:PiggyBac transposable element-derived protein domain-containing protein n=1 Tax=Periplaneta americana TaxID=6978 RepID=A0ABQ8S984_PERAM|nr:hypothetical protein ANN_19205 [Periplaneta americana]
MSSLTLNYYRRVNEVSGNDLSDAETVVSDHDTQIEEEIPDEGPREILQFSTENSSELDQPEIFAVPDVAARKVVSSAFLQREPAITTGPAQEPEASTLAERELEVCAVGDREPEIFQTYSTGNGESVYGKNRYKLFTAPFHSSRTRQRNIARVKVPQLIGAARTIHSNEPIEFWKLLFDDKILNCIVTNTNAKITELSANYGKTTLFTNHIDTVELNAFLGLLYLSGVFKSGNEVAKCLWNADGTGRDISRATMSLDRFLFLLIAIWFYDPAERELRKKMGIELPLFQKSLTDLLPTAKRTIHHLNF